MEEVVGAWMVPSRQPASFLSTPQSPMAPWSRSPWRTARWCGRRGGSFSDSECALGQGGGWAREISPGTPQSFLSSLGTVRSQDPCWPQPRGPITLWGWSVGRLLAQCPWSQLFSFVLQNTVPFAGSSGILISEEETSGTCSNVCNYIPGLVFTIILFLKS